MDKSQRGGFKKSFLLLLFLYLTIQQSPSVEAATDDEYSELSKNQGLFDESTDPRTKFVSSLSNILEQDEEAKRSSSFFPLRGKKAPNNEAEGQYQFLPDAEDKRSQFFPLRGKKIPFDLKRASYFMPMRGRKNEEWNDFSEEEDSQDKRASSFMPMRGKKRSDGSSNTYQHFGKSGTYAKVKTDIILPSSSDSNRTEVKRLSSFVPVRGRKFDASGKSSDHNITQMENLRNKRSISFTPMRGRRLLSNSDEKTESEFPENIVTTLLEKRAYSFMPMRGRRTPQIFETNMASNRNDDSLDEKDILQDTLDSMASMNLEDKRASSFMPMRGRRQSQHDPLQSESLKDKRKMSFMPMRGRKNFDDDSYFLDRDDKRASSFMPMRGRRTFNIEDDMRNKEKSGMFFMPLRGRRTLESMEYPDKRASSFMPMRGRRSIPNFDFHDTMEDQDKRSAFMPMLGRKLLSENSDENEKRAYSFMPMRGKRTNVTDTDNFDLDSSDYGVEKRGYAFMPMRGRRWTPDMDQASYYYHAYPFFMPAGIGSALISRPFSNRDVFIKSFKKAASKNRRQYDWESVKRAFHATRGKRLPNGYLDDNEESDSENDDSEIEENIKSERNLIENLRLKRNIYQPQIVAFQPQRKYIALKRPMSFFATRGKRFDDSSNGRISKLP